MTQESQETDVRESNASPRHASSPHAIHRGAQDLGSLDVALEAAPAPKGERFAKLPEGVLELSAAQLRTYAAVSLLRDYRTDLLEHSVAVIAETARIDERTVRRALASLVALGWLELVRAHTRRDPAVYRVCNGSGRPLRVGALPRSEGGTAPGQRGAQRPPLQTDPRESEREGGSAAREEDDMTDPEGMTAMFDVEPVKTTRKAARKAPDPAKLTPAQRIASRWYDTREAATGLPPGEYPKVLRHAADLLKADIPEDLLLAAAEAMGRDARHTNLRGAYDDLVAQRRRPEYVPEGPGTAQVAREWLGGFETTGPDWSETEWGRTARPFRPARREDLAPPSWSSRPA